MNIFKVDILNTAHLNSEENFLESLCISLKVLGKRFYLGPGNSKMADQDKLLSKDLCSYCGRNTTKKQNKCVKCNKTYHNSCATRVTCCGVKLTKNKVINKESDVNSDSDSGEDDQQAKYQDLLKENKQLKELNFEMANTIKKLNEKISNMQKEILHYQEKNTRNTSTSEGDGIQSKIKTYINAQIEEKFSTLQAEINNLKAANNKLSSLKDNKTQVDTKSHTSQKQGMITKKVTTPMQINTNDINNKPGTPKQINLEELKRKQLSIMSDIIALPGTSHSKTDSPDDREKEEDFIQVEHRNKRRLNNKKDYGKKVIQGNATSDDNRFSAVKITKRTWIHVANFRLDLTAEELTKYLNKKFNRDDFLCFKIKPKHRWPKFSSFKIGGDIALEETLLNPNSWNAGLTVCKFDFFLASRNKLLFEKRNTQSDTDE